MFPWISTNERNVLKILTNALTKFLSCCVEVLWFHPKYKWKPNCGLSSHLIFLRSFACNEKCRVVQFLAKHPFLSPYDVIMCYHRYEYKFCLVFNAQFLRFKQHRKFILLVAKCALGYAYHLLLQCFWLYSLHIIYFAFSRQQQKQCTHKFISFSFFMFEFLELAAYFFALYPSSITVQ